MSHVLPEGDLQFAFDEHWKVLKWDKERLSSGGLAVEVAHKIRDSIAGLVWACNRELDQGRLAPLLRSLLSHKSKIPIVLWLEEERPLALAPAAASALGEAIKREFRWLNTSVTVMSRAFAEKKPLPEIVVTSLAHKRP